jgi:hypothetical protein
MNDISYLFYQAERPLSAAEQREADVRAHARPTGTGPFRAIPRPP